MDLSTTPTPPVTFLDSPEFPLHLPHLKQNPPASPNTPWVIQKFGGTSVGKFADKIASDIVPRYMSTHRVAVVCSARSGSTKALGTTNLLLRAASEALRPTPTSLPTTSVPGTPGVVQGPIFQNGGAMSGYATPTSEGGERGRSLSLASGRGFTVLEGEKDKEREGTASPSPFHPVNSTSGGAFFSSTSRGRSAPDLPAFYSTIDLLQSEHLAAARSLISGEALLRELEEEIARDCEGLKMFLRAAQVIDEISPRSKDSIVGVGERLACKLVAAALQDRGVDAEFVSLENIVPSSLHELSDYGERTVRLEQPFYDAVASAVAERISQCGRRVPVVTGFFGPVPNSLLTQIGRGYTDLLAALLAAGLHPETSELQIWKEVDGIFTADPRKVPTARLLEVIYPEEAKELTYYGSEVVHPFVMDQVMRMAIPIRIKNIENPQGSGTIISPSLPSPPSSPGAGAPPGAPRRLPTAVTIKDNIIILNVASTGRKTSTHGFLASIFGILDRWGVTVDLVSTSEVHVSMALEDFTAGSGGKRMRDRLVHELSKIGHVTLSPGMAILSLVGSQMRHMVGISGRMFTTLAEGNINIEMISQGANEINISCVIDGREAVKALNLIHMSCLQVKPDGPKGRGPWLY